MYYAISRIKENGKICTKCKVSNHIFDKDLLVLEINKEDFENDLKKYKVDNNDIIQFIDLDNVKNKKIESLNIFFNGVAKLRILSTSNFPVIEVEANNEKINDINISIDSLQDSNQDSNQYKYYDSDFNNFILVSKKNLIFIKNKLVEFSLYFYIERKKHESAIKALGTEQLIESYDFSLDSNGEEITIKTINL